MGCRENLLRADHGAGTESAKAGIHPSDGAPRIVTGIDNPAIVLPLDTREQPLLECVQIGIGCECGTATGEQRDQRQGEQTQNGQSSMVT
jgi:hypothetical protein